MRAGQSCGQRVTGPNGRRRRGTGRSRTVAIARTASFERTVVDQDIGSPTRLGACSAGNECGNDTPHMDIVDDGARRTNEEERTTRNHTYYPEQRPIGHLGSIDD